MTMRNAALVLASKSPRRAELLRQIGVSFEQVSIETDETPLLDETPETLVLRLAQQKALAGLAEYPERKVLGSDTIVVVGGQILGKPADAEDSLRMLSLLSGRTHEVLSGVALASGGESSSRLSRTRVNFRDISPAEMRVYWQTGEPCDKAGSYAIQGLAATFVCNIEGSYSGVMGLPIFETAALLAEAGIPLWCDGTQ